MIIGHLFREHKGHDEGDDREHNHHHATEEARVGPVAVHARLTRVHVLGSAQLVSGSDTPALILFVFLRHITPHSDENSDAEDTVLDQAWIQIRTCNPREWKHDGAIADHAVIGAGWIVKWPVDVTFVPKIVFKCIFFIEMENISAWQDAYS